MTALGFRIVWDYPRPPQELVDALGAIPTAIISDNMNRMFSAAAALLPVHRGGRLSGVALTVRTRPGDNLMIHKALDMARPGDVIVVDGSGDVTNALVGEIMVSYGRARGVAGFVIDGAVRDRAAIGTGDLPVYARGVTHRGPYKDGPGEINVAVSIGGMVVSPGDIVVGDEDGVVAVPQLQAEAILELAGAQQQREEAILQSIADRTIDRSWVDQALAAKGCRS